MTMTEPRQSHRQHGTRAKYVLDKCRCEPCTLANRAAARDRYQKMHRPDQLWLPYVPAGRARRHVQQLREQGIGLKTVAKLSGVPHGSLSKLMYGDPQRGLAQAVGTSGRAMPSYARSSESQARGNAMSDDVIVDRKLVQEAAELLEYHSKYDDEARAVAGELRDALASEPNTNTGEVKQ